MASTDDNDVEPVWEQQGGTSVLGQRLATPVGSGAPPACVKNVGHSWNAVSPVQDRVRGPLEGVGA